MKETDHEKLAEIIKDINVAMMTTTDLSGKMHSRPMVTVAFERSANSVGTIWFFSKRESLKVHNIEEEKDVLLTYAHPVSQDYVVIHGLAGIERDKLKVVTLWDSKLKEWFPKGVEDPEMVMIKIDVLNAEIWDSPPSKAGRILGMAKSLVTGHPYEKKKIKSHQIGPNIH
jgi:general stress protein 26